MHKLIGVTPRILTEDTVKKQFVNFDYVNALISKGFNVIMLTLDNPNIEEVLELCDGFLVTGGCDVDPTAFGETNEGLSKGVEPQLDQIDKDVVEYAVKHKKPMLGICRGHQTINVFMGGTLFQDIGDKHGSIRMGDVAKTVPNRLLDLEPVILTNSYHHQAVKDPAPGMEVIAMHPDGTIEAMIHNELPIICIQWHPEKVLDTKVSQIIFNKFQELVK